jgi:hypothetical protein
MIIILPAWVYISFLAAQIITSAILGGLELLQVPIKSLNENVYTTIISAFVYMLTLFLVIGLPAIVKKQRIDFYGFGLHRAPNWIDITMAPVGLIVYFVISVVLVTLATSFLPWFNEAESQSTGFSQLFDQYEYILAFVTLVVIAPVAEEILFRGYLFGKLKKYFPLWLAIFATSIVFGLIHGAWNLALDTFSLSIVLCILRQTTGSLWAPILLHMTKNSIAFYILFINPMLFHTLGG